MNRTRNWEKKAQLYVCVRCNSRSDSVGCFHILSDIYIHLFLSSSQAIKLSYLSYSYQQLTNKTTGPKQNRCNATTQHHFSEVMNGCGVQTPVGKSKKARLFGPWLACVSSWTWKLASCTIIVRRITGSSYCRLVFLKAHQWNQWSRERKNLYISVHSLYIFPLFPKYTVRPKGSSSRHDIHKKRWPTLLIIITKIIIPKWR